MLYQVFGNGKGKEVARHKAQGTRHKRVWRSDVLFFSVIFLFYFFSYFFGSWILVLGSFNSLTMNINKLLFAFALILIAQAITFYMVQGQFIFRQLKNNLTASIFMSIPAAICGFYATRFFVEAFNGLLWPARMIGFAVGIILFSALTYVHLKELPDTKTILTILLAGGIIAIQLLWK
jgi:hypothetical protein